MNKTICNILVFILLGIAITPQLELSAENFVTAKKQNVSEKFGGIHARRSTVVPLVKKPYKVRVM